MQKIVGIHKYNTVKGINMNKRTVNIVSLVILLSMICAILEMCLYYFVPQHFVTVIFAIVTSLCLSHFFLESSLNYDYNFIHSIFMVISSIIFGIAVYAVSPNQWIHYDFSLVILVLANWLTPFIYCTIRDLFDRGPRFDGYHVFFRRMSVLFIVMYIFVIVKQYFITPIVPPYPDSPFGAHNFIPFMSTGSYIETALNDGTSLIPLFAYMAEVICIGIPFGYFARTCCRKVPFILRILIYMVYPLILETAQYVTNIGRADIDDYVMTLIGIVIGLIIFHIMNALYQTMASRDFMIGRNQQQKHFY